MQTFWELEQVERNPNSVLTVGTFDGIHLGHRSLFEELGRRAKTRGVETTVVTFEPHPQLVLKSPKKKNLKILTTTDEKIEILRQLNLDRVIVIPFTLAFSKTSSQDFVQKILFDRIGFQEIVIGHDHAFGKDRQGDINTLREMGKMLGFAVDELPVFKIDDVTVSSSRIRELLGQGHIREANKFLGRNYSFHGVVVGGDERGREFRFPTANLELSSPDKLIPQDGVYAVRVDLHGRPLKGMMNIGVRPTFDSHKHTIEIHLFDFEQNIYGESLKVECVEKIRNEMRFEGPEQLVEQLKSDKEESLKILY